MCHVFPFIHPWIVALFPYRNYYKQHCNEHKDTDIIVCPSDKYSKVGLLDYTVVLLLILGGMSTLFSIIVASVDIPTNSGERFLHIFTNTFSLLFDNGHSDRCEVMSHRGFSLHFPDDYQKQ